MTVAGPARAYPAAFFAVSLIVAAVLASAVLRPFLAAIAWAIVLAVGLRGPWRAVERRLAPRRGLAAGLAAVLTALVVLLPTAVLGTILFNQATQAATRLAEELRTRQVATFGDVVALPGVARGLDWVRARTGVTPEALRGRLAETAATVSTFVAAKSGGFVLGFIDAVVTFAATIFLLFFLLRDGDAMAAALRDLLPVRPAERDRIMGSLGRMLLSIFRGSLLCALVQGASGGIGWALAGLPSPVLAGALMAILSLLPIGGTAIVWLPGVAWAWASGHPGAALFLFLWGAVVTSFAADNLLKPVLLRGTDELSTLVVFLGVFGGLSAFGLLGIFIGPITLAVASMLIDVLRTLSREARGAEP